MAREIVQLDLNDFDELMTMLDRAFDHDTGEFQQLLPSLYQHTDAHARHHYGIRDDGKLVAALGIYPLTWHLNNRALDVAGIGGVGTDPDWRGKGLMSELLSHVVPMMREQGYPLSWLGGQRQRYRRFGWEKAGVCVNFALNSTNLRHEPDVQHLPAIKLQPLTNDDAPELTQLQQWHDAQPMRCARDWRGFAHVLRDWHGKPHLAYDARGELAGYVVLKKDGQFIGELVGRDARTEQAMVRAVVEAAEGAQVTLPRPPLSLPLNHWLSRVAESTTAADMGNWQVFDWPTTIEALLNAKCEFEALPSGNATIGIEGEPRALRIAVVHNHADAQWVDQTPSLTVDAPTAMRLLLGPSAPSQVIALPAEAASLEAWCPLPAALTSQDKV